MGWSRVPANALNTKRQITIPQLTIKEAGYIFVYLSYEDLSNNYAYFDDFQIVHTKTNVIQYNEYYPFGMQAAASWTRENVTGNNFLANGGTELNPTSALYDLEFRNYDPVLGRMSQVDPMAGKYASTTPYNYAFNSPIVMNDPRGDESRFSGKSYCSWCDRGNGNAGGFDPWGGNIKDNGTAGGGGSAGITRDGANEWTIDMNMVGAHGGQWSAGSGYENWTEQQAWNFTINYAVQYGIAMQSSGQNYNGLTMLNVWAGKQVSANKYAGAWTRFDPEVAKMMVSRGYSLQTKSGFFLSSPQQTQGGAWDNVPSPGWDLNGDGILSLNEANRWYRNRLGISIEVDASKIDLRNVNPNLFSKVGDTRTVNLLASGPFSVGVVYGKLDLTYMGNNQVSIAPNSYDFNTSDHEWFGGSFWRNVFTVMGHVFAGEGTPFMVNFNGLGNLTYDKYPKHDTFMTKKTGNL